MLRKKRNDQANEAESKKNEERTEGKPSFSGSTVNPAEKTLIGEDISIKGSIHGKGNLLIQGSIQGNIDLDGNHLVIGPHGKVAAEVNAENVTISGGMAGNINAKGKVEITKTAVFNGEIKAKRISVEDGAYLKAVIELERTSKSQAPTKPAIPISKTPAPEKEASK